MRIGLAVRLGLRSPRASTFALAQQRAIGVGPKGTPTASIYLADSWAVMVGIEDYQHSRAVSAPVPRDYVTGFRCAKGLP